MRSATSTIRRRSQRFRAPIHNTSENIPVQPSSQPKTKVMQKPNFFKMRGGALHVHPCASTILCISLLLGLSASLQAANFTTAVQQAVGQNWDGLIWNPGPVVPTGGTP